MYVVEEQRAGTQLFSVAHAAHVLTLHVRRLEPWDAAVGWVSLLYSCPVPVYTTHLQVHWQASYENDTLFVAVSSGLHRLGLLFQKAAKLTSVDFVTSSKSIVDSTELGAYFSEARGEYPHHWHHVMAQHGVVSPYLVLLHLP